jgi:hypothetical protein
MLIDIKKVFVQNEMQELSLSEYHQIQGGGLGGDIRRGIVSGFKNTGEFIRDIPQNTGKALDGLGAGWNDFWK